VLLDVGVLAWPKWLEVLRQAVVVLAVDVGRQRVHALRGGRAFRQILLGRVGEWRPGLDVVAFDAARGTPDFAALQLALGSCHPGGEEWVAF
jgi:hypothetical protein